MKSLAELQAIRDRAKMAVNVRENSEAKTRVLVGMATCGTQQAQVPVLTAISDEVNKRDASRRPGHADGLHRHLPVRADRRSYR